MEGTSRTHWVCDDVCGGNVRLLSLNRVNYRSKVSRSAGARIVLRHLKIGFVLGVILLGLMNLPNVHAAVIVTVTPASQVIPQGSVAMYAIDLSGALPGSTYTLSLSGLVGGAYHFSPNPVTTTAAGTGTSSLTIDTGVFPIYCPGTYPFTVKATTSAPAPDTGTSPAATVMVVQVGPALAVALSTDKSTYRIGDKITILISVNRPAEGQLTISPPSGAPSVFSYVAYGPTYAISKTLTASQPVGRYTVSFQADDFCGGFSSAVVYFDVTPDTYDVSLSFSGVPSDVSVNIQVDGQDQGTMGGSDIKKLTFKLDTTHTVVVDQYVSGAAGVRYYCAQNSWTVGSAGSHTFTYETHYLFTVVTDPDGVTQVSGGGWFREGTTVQTSQAQETIAGPPGTQYIFKGWEVDGVIQSGNPVSLTLDRPRKAIAKYQTQYQLLVDSSLGDPEGSGYYDADSTATFSVTSPVGLLVQQVFVRWEGDYSGSSPQGSVTMDRSKVVHAIWTTSYTQLYILLGVVAAVAIIVAFLVWRRRQGPAPTLKPTPPMPGEGEQGIGAPPSEAPPTTAETGGTVRCSSCGADVPSGQSFCHNCGVKIS